MDYFDLAAEHDGDLSRGVRAAARTRFCVVSFDLRLAVPDRAVAGHRAGAEPGGGQCELRRDSPSDKGHDAFLLDEPDFHRTLTGFLAGCARQANLS